LEFRQILEVGLASLAAEKATDADIEMLQATLDKYKNELEHSHVDCSTDLSFHTALVETAKNPFAARVWQMISARLSEVLARASDLPAVGATTLNDHQRIFRAIRNRNPKAAREAMRAHLENAERTWQIALQDKDNNHGDAKRTNARVPAVIPK